MNERTRKRLLDLKARQDAGEHMPCPRCGMDTMKPALHTNALSRVADIMICDACGTAESLLAQMGQTHALTSWAAFRPVPPPSDFKALPATEVLAKVVHGQAKELVRIYELCQQHPEDAEDYRNEAFETCPGLTELWTQPFQAKFQAVNGAVLIRLRTAANGEVQMTGDITEK